MQFLKVAMEHAQQVVTGKVDVQLLKGNTIMRGRSVATIGGDERQNPPIVQPAPREQVVAGLALQQGAGLHGRRGWLQPRRAPPPPRHAAFDDRGYLGD
jgi:hypothetical protein